MFIPFPVPFLEESQEIVAILFGLLLLLLAMNYFIESLSRTGKERTRRQEDTASTLFLVILTIASGWWAIALGGLILLFQWMHRNRMG